MGTESSHLQKDAHCPNFIPFRARSYNPTITSQSHESLQWFLISNYPNVILIVLWNRSNDPMIWIYQYICYFSNMYDS